MLRLILILIPLLACCAIQASAASQVPQGRIDRLAKGINLSHWFSQVWPEENNTIETLQTYITEADIQALADAGFTHLRLPIDPTKYFIDKDTSRIDPAWMAELEKAVAMITARQMGVILDLHAFGGYISRMEKQDEQVAKVAATWTTIASHFAGSDPDLVFFEALNEPKMNDQARYQVVIEALHAAIRAAAPQHTIIISGKHFSGAADLAVLEPMDDPNVVYNFHCYEPMIFTHQGASWAWKPWESCHGVPWPSRSNPEQLAEAKANAAKGWSKKLLDQYRDEDWNKAKLESVLDQAVAWATTHQVAITCNEFGVFKPFSPADSRIRWLTEIREAMEARSIGWCMWDYKDSFGLTTETVGNPPPFDADVLTALGMTR